MLNYWINIDWPYGVTVSTLDFESINPSSNLGRTFFLFFFQIQLVKTNAISNYLYNYNYYIKVKDGFVFVIIKEENLIIKKIN